MFENMSTAKILACLLAIPPIELKSVELLRQLRATTGDWFPATAVDVTEATTELITYTRLCAQLGNHLQTLPPVPLIDKPSWEFAL